MQASRIFILIAILYLSSFFIKALINKGTVYGDGRYYYSYLRSMVIDHNLDFHNEYAHYGISEPLTQKNLVRNVYPIGPALFWSPWFIMAHTILRGDGYALPYQIIVGLQNVIYVLAGLVLLYRLLHKHTQETIALWTIIGITFATNLFFYGALDTVNSHSISFFISVVIVTLFFDRQSVFLMGIGIGILSMIRSQDALFLLLLLPHFTITRTIKGLLGFILGFIPQLIFWQILYDTITQSPYLDSDHYFDILNPKLLEVLFSSNNGLFFWTPIIAFCVFGLLSKRITFFLLFVLQWLLIASWSFWWQGESYSGRMFISLLPVFAVGLVNVLQKQSPLGRKILVGFFSGLNCLMIVLYLWSH